MAEPLVTNFDENFCLSHSEIVPVPMAMTGKVVEDETANGIVTDEPLPSVDPINKMSNASDRHIISKWDNVGSYSDDYDINQDYFKKVCTDFVDNLTITDSEIADIEIQRRGQSENDAWFNYRCGRVTASKFGEIKNRRPTTAPDGLLRDIFKYHPKKKTVQPWQCKEGLRLEPIIREKYIAQQRKNGHTGVEVAEKGLLIDKTAPLVAASIDGEVHDPTANHSPTGNLEIKYIQFPINMNTEHGSNLLSMIAQNVKNSCLEITGGTLQLKTRHHYYAQIQGGMDVTQRKWCDLAVYSYSGDNEDLFIERIYFDPIFWNNLKVCLLNFCLDSVVPEILTKRVKRGKELNPLKYIYKARNDL